MPTTLTRLVAAGAAAVALTGCGSTPDTAPAATPEPVASTIEEWAVLVCDDMTTRPGLHDGYYPDTETMATAAGATRDLTDAGPPPGIGDAVPAWAELDGVRTVLSSAAR